MDGLFVVDSHCHLDFPNFDADRNAVIERARLAGVKTMVAISTRVERFRDLAAIVAPYPEVLLSVGTHPLSAAEEPDVPTEDYVRLAAAPKVVAIGEAGLDYFHDRAPRALQEQVFRRQIAAARTTGLPLVVHSRDCDRDMIRILEEESAIGAFRFVLHCFSATRELAHRGLELGGYLSFSGILTFRRSDELRAIAAEAPADRLLVETDAPYLAPAPNRGKRNEPAYVRSTLDVLAMAKSIGLEDMAKITSDNFFRLFARAVDPRATRTVT